jgi:hypothetical protein
MHLTDHLSDVQLNEYLDHETKERAQIELHLSMCRDCSARLTALQDLFAEIESLPELELSQDFREAPLRNQVTHSMPGSGASVQLTRSLTLTVTLQAALTIAAVIVAAPFVMQFVSPYLSKLAAPSPLDLLFSLQVQWTAWLDMLSQLQLPSIPQTPSIEISSLMLAWTVLGASLFWLIGNGLLLRNQMK